MDAQTLEWLSENQSLPDGWLDQVFEHGFRISKIREIGPISGENLILVWGKDAKKLSEVAVDKKSNKSSECYELRSKTDMSWVQIAERVGVSQPNACTMAKKYAKSHKLNWPPRHP